MKFVGIFALRDTSMIVNLPPRVNLRGGALADGRKKEGYTRVFFWYHRNSLGAMGSC